MLLKILELCETHHIDAVSYKGPILAQSIYGSLALRYFGDIDLLVHQRDVKALKDLLLDAGYRLPLDLTAAQRVGNATSNLDIMRGDKAAFEHVDETGFQRGRADVAGDGNRAAGQRRGGAAGPKHALAGAQGV